MVATRMESDTKDAAAAQPAVAASTNPPPSPSWQPPANSTSSPALAARNPIVRAVLLALLLAVGVIIWWRFAYFSGLGLRRVGWLFITAIIAIVPPTRRAVAWAFDRLRHPAPRARRHIALGVAGASVAYLIGTGYAQERTFIP